MEIFNFSLRGLRLINLAMPLSRVRAGERGIATVLETVGRMRTVFRVCPCFP